jgi:spore coat polysaccharide biosynthesis protein SpsF
MTTVGVVQARMGSGRLPGKVMLPLGDAPVIAYPITALGTVLDDVVVATTFHARDDIIAQAAEDRGVGVYRGSEDDVLGRIYRAGLEKDADTLVRVTADNPFVGSRVVEAAVERMRQTDAEYLTTKRRRTLPVGVDVDAFDMTALGTAEDRGRASRHREHVTPYLLEHHDRFEIADLTAADVFGPDPPEARPQLRLTLDEAADYAMYTQIVELLGPRQEYALADVIAAIDDHGLAELNAGVDQRTGY